MQTVWNTAEAYIPVVRVAAMFCLSERTVFCIAEDCSDTVISFPFNNSLKQNGHKVQHLTFKTHCNLLTPFMCVFFSLPIVILNST
jgi:hypothetical protein